MAAPRTDPLMENNWEKAKKIFADAIKLTPELRQPYLNEVCGGDVETRREIESLLASYFKAETFLESPAVGEVADVFYQPQNLKPGNSFAHYEIIEMLGKGGMGEVYLAEDKKLERKVAVKILNERFARHESNLQRFRQEAKAASALNHPNILIIHEIGESENTPYIISEFIKGKTLRDILNVGSFELPEILNISIQLNAALAVAHEAHLIHRDIKPENVMIRDDGIIKVLDFGLAKLVRNEEWGSKEKNSTLEDSPLLPTPYSLLSTPGLIMGTINYMSPEQAKGESLDERTDIFSVGIVLYEMLTGQNPFKGETINHTVIAILEHEPPPLALFTRNLPDEIERIVKKCLEKNQNERYSTTKDLLSDLKSLEKRLEFEFELERTSEPDKQQNKQTAEVKGGIETEPILPQPLHNLSQNLNPIIGREREISEIRNLLLESDVRLVTMTGIGGTGKTRLAQAVATELLPDFPDGVFFIELAGVKNAEFVASTIAQTLGLKEAVGKTILENLKDYTANKKMLLVADNFEQIIEAAPLIGELLSAFGLKILITSRALLRLSAEVEFIVPPLAVPDNISRISTEKLAEYEAIKLFVHRARKAKPGFILTNENAGLVAEICSRLDGLPLAIELASARLKIFSPSAILEKLENRLRLLTGGARDLPERQQTMRGTIQWSYLLLNEPEKRLFRRLAVFGGGFTFEAAENICHETEDDFLEVLTSLIDKSLLLIKESAENGEPRFRMLEVVRDYALELPETILESEAICLRHAEYFLALAESAEPHLQTVQAQEWLKNLETEHDNLRLALSRTIQTHPATAARMAAALRLFWNFHGHFTEGRHWLELVLQNENVIPPEIHWKLLHGVGIICIFQGDYQSSKKFLEQSRMVAVANHDRQRIALSSNSLVMVLMELNELETARKLTLESLEIGRELDDKKVIALSLYCLGNLRRLNRDYGAARQYFEQALGFWEQMDVGNGMGGCLMSLGVTAFQQGDLQMSANYYRKSLEIAQKLGHKGLISYCLDGFAALSLKNDDLSTAARLAGAAENLRETIGFVMENLESRFRENYLNELKTKLNQAEFAEFYEAGRKLNPEDSITLALSVDL